MLYHTGFLSNPLNGCHMFKRRYVALLPALILLSACSSKPKTEAVQQTAGAPSGGFLLEPQHNMMQMGGDFANNPAAAQPFSLKKPPISDINAENAMMHAGHASEADINGHVDGWIKAHQQLFDGWVKEALAAQK